MKEIITKNYEKIDGELKDQVEYPDSVSNVKDHVKITLAGRGKSPRQEQDEVICSNVTVKHEIDFTMKLKLEPEVCTDLAGQSFKINIRVFGEKSTLTLDIGRNLLHKYFHIF